MKKEILNKHDGKKGYRLVSLIADPILERGFIKVRQKSLEISGIGPHNKVLDVCCGTGTQAALFANTGAVVYGVEISDFMLAKAKKKEIPNLVFVQGDAANTGFDDSTFDIVTTGFSLHEVDEQVRTGFVDEMIRVAKPGGFLVFSDFSVQTRGGFKNRMNKRRSDILEWLAGKEHYQNYAKWMKNGGLAEFLSLKGLKAEKTIPLNGGHILIVKALNIK